MVHLYYASTHPATTVCNNHKRLLKKLRCFIFALWFRFIGFFSAVLDWKVSSRDYDALPDRPDQCVLLCLIFIHIAVYREGKTFKNKYRQKLVPLSSINIRNKYTEHNGPKGCVCFILRAALGQYPTATTSGRPRIADQRTQRSCFWESKRLPGKPAAVTPQRFHTVVFIEFANLLQYQDH